MTDELKRYIHDLLPRELLLDLFDMAPARALEAFKLIKEHTDLEGKSARGAEGQIRYRITEKSFQDICTAHGGYLLEGPCVPKSTLKFFQPFMRYVREGQGLVLALASMPFRNELPSKNQSRLAGVSLNFNWTPRLDFDGKGIKFEDLFVCFLISRDPTRSGQVSEVAIGVINSEYDSYIFYSSIEEFLSYYSSVTRSATVDDPTSPSGGPSGGKKLVKLKASKKKFDPTRKKPDETHENDAEANVKRNAKDN